MPYSQHLHLLYIVIDKYFNQMMIINGIKKFSMYCTYLRNYGSMLLLHQMYTLLNIYDISCIVYKFDDVGAYCHNYVNMYNTC